jgi:hypothetical protein
VIYERNSPEKGFEQLQGTEWQTYQENLLKNRPKTHRDLENNLKIAIARTHKHQLKLGLEIILLLLSHPQKDVRAFSLGRLYPLITKESLRELIIKDLKDMRDDSQLNVSAAAQESLNGISGIVHNLVLADIISEVFVEFSVDLEKYGLTHNINFHSPFSSHPLEGKDLEGGNSFFNSKNRYIFPFIRGYRQMNVLLDKILFSNQLEELFPELTSMEEFSIGNILEEGIIPYSDLSNFQWKPADSLERLANIYAHTFMEEGHLHRLKTYLDDDDYHVRQIGANALIEVVSFILNCPDEKSKENVTHPQNQHRKINLPSLAKLSIIHFLPFKRP